MTYKNTFLHVQLDRQQTPPRRRARSVDLPRCLPCQAEDEADVLPPIRTNSGFVRLCEGGKAKSKDVRLSGDEIANTVCPKSTNADVEITSKEVLSIAHSITCPSCDSLSLQQPDSVSSADLKSEAARRVAQQLEKLHGQSPTVSSCHEHDDCVKLTVKNAFLHVQLEKGQHDCHECPRRERGRSAEWHDEPIVGGFVCRGGQDHSATREAEAEGAFLPRPRKPSAKAALNPATPSPQDASRPTTPEKSEPQDKKHPPKRRRRKANEEKCKMRPNELTVRVEPVPQWYTTATFSLLLKGLGMERHIDFLYIPPLRKGNRGFAIVNLVDVEGQFWFTKSLNNCVLPGAEQVSTVTKAKVQGLENNVRYYSNCSRQQEQNKPIVDDWYGQIR